MTETEIVVCVRELASDLRNLPPSEVFAGPAYKNLASVPGKGGALTQWFNRETNAKKKRLVSDLLGHLARASYQQTPEFYAATATELEGLCDRIEAQE